MRIRPLSFFIVPFGTVLALLLALALVLSIVLPSKAKAGEPDMKKVCYVMAEMTAKACYRTGLPATTNDAAKVFLKDVCNAAGDEANETCLSGEATKRFGSLPICDGVSLFTASAILKGGAKTVAALGVEPGATLDKLTGFVRELAKATANKTRGECTEEAKKAAPAKTLPSEGVYI
jgi:hypothetical protein